MVNTYVSSYILTFKARQRRLESSFQFRELNTIILIITASLLCSYGTDEGFFRSCSLDESPQNGCVCKVIYLKSSSETDSNFHVIGLLLEGTPHLAVQKVGPHPWTQDLFPYQQPTRLRSLGLCRWT